jgi:hypothetical protein
MRVASVEQQLWDMHSKNQSNLIRRQHAEYALSKALAEIDRLKEFVPEGEHVESPDWAQTREWMWTSSG